MQIITYIDFAMIAVVLLMPFYFGGLALIKTFEVVDKPVKLNPWRFILLLFGSMGVITAVRSALLLVIVVAQNG